MRELQGSRVCSWACLLAVLIMAALSSCAGRGPSPTHLGKDLRVVLPEVLSHENPTKNPPSLRNASDESNRAIPRKLPVTLHHFPLSFTPNRGQMDQEVKFYGRSGLASLFFTPTEVVYSFVQRQEEASSRRVRRSASDENSRPWEEGNSQGHIVRLQFVGANEDPVIDGQQELLGKTNYFIG